MGPILTLVIIIFLLILAAIALGVAAGFIANAAVRVTKIDDWKKDHSLKRAHTYLSWAATVGWVGLAILVLIIVLYGIFGWESIEITVGWASKGLLILAVIFLGLAGSLAAVGLSYIDKSAKKSDAHKNGAYRQALIGTILSLVAAVLVFGLFLYVMFHKPKTKKDEEEEKKQETVQDLQSKLIEEKKAEIEEKTAQARNTVRKLR